MAGPEALRELGAEPNSIWGDEDETVVYAQVLANSKSAIFRFCLDPSSPPESLTSQVVNVYHGNDDDIAQPAFADRDAMRDAIWSSIATVWPRCSTDATIFTPGNMVNVVLGETNPAEASWSSYRDSLYDTYLALLSDLKPADLVPPTGSGSSTLPVVGISDVSFISTLGGKGCSMRAVVGSVQYVFKGVDFQTFLQVHDEDDEFARATVDTWARSTKLIASLPQRHPRIQSPPQLLVSTPSPDGTGPVIMGHLSAFMSKGDLLSAIDAANDDGTRIALAQKARWCLHIASSLEYTHNTMHTYHMDVKPGNFLIDDTDGLVLIDWEQSGAPPTTLAPEADGTWDVAVGSGGKLVYTKYAGAERRNMPEGGGQATFNTWNVFPVWQASCPRATELAEVFAVGRTMWMLLSQTSQDFEDVSHPEDVCVSWEGADDIPKSWVDGVMKCMASDANDRPLLAEVVEFWTDAAAALGN